MVMESVSLATLKSRLSHYLQAGEKGKEIEVISHQHPIARLVPLAKRLPGLEIIPAGIVVGLVGALAATSLLSALLYGVGATDFLTYLAVIVLLACAAFLAGLVPARRAMKVDPIVALRYE